MEGYSGSQKAQLVFRFNETKSTAVPGQISHRIVGRVGVECRVSGSAVVPFRRLGLLTIVRRNVPFQ